MEVKAIELTRSKTATPIIYGSAKRTSNINNVENRNENSISLKDLSKSEILKLAEERTKNAVTIRRSPNNLSHKRIAVSENVTRHQALKSDPITTQNLRLTSGSNQLENHEEFLENLFKKMTAEQFIPLGPMDGSKKRTCLWNKENSSNHKKTKRRKENRANAIFIPPTMAAFKDRRLSCNSTSLSQMEIRSQRGGFEMLKQERRPTPWKKSSLDLIEEDINMEESDLDLIDHGSSLAAKESLNDSSSRNWITDNGTSTTSYETVELQHRCTIDKFNQESDHPMMPCNYYTKPYLIVNNFPNSPCLSTIEECHEPSVIVPPPACDAVYREFERHSNVSLNFTPPLSPKLGDCNTDDFGIDRGDSINWRSLQTLTCSSGDLNHSSSVAGKMV